MTSFQASVTRTALGLPALNINDGTKFRVGIEIMGGTVQWDRRIVTSPYVHGDFTVNRRMQNVTETISVYVYGSDQAALQTNAAEIIAAFTQPVFNLSLALDSSQYSYQCEAADYTFQWSNAHMFSGQAIINFQVPRIPIPLVGV